MASGRRRVRPLSTAVRHAPVPEPIRRNLYRYLLWRPFVRQVPIDRLLLGGQNSLTARELTEAYGRLMWASTPVSAGPHAALLRAHQVTDLDDDDILASDYAALARDVIAATGNFFEARDDRGIVEVARHYLAGQASGQVRAAGGGIGRSARGSAVRVARIRNSDCYQVIDGHHRVAALAVRGEQHVPVRQGWLSVSTPLQDTLNEMSWIGGQRELYQPLEAPELATTWVTVRRCTDRLAAMQDFLPKAGVVAGDTYVDVASCYGWFVSQMAIAGLDAYGIERDRLGPVVGEAAYALDPLRIQVGDAVDLLSTAPAHWDVVSCLSLVHHFALGRGSISAEDFLQLLDRATGKVLFIDTGQTHEEWLTNRLPGWHTEDVRRRLEELSFDEVIDLGPDSDAVGAYALNYGRHLFACVRHA